MAGATRRSARTTKPKHVDQNADRPATRSTTARQRAETSKPTTKDAVTTLVPGRKRKALSDNTNAEKKKSTKADGGKGKVGDKAKDKKPAVLKAKNTSNPVAGASTSKSTPMRLVVEIPVRKRRGVQPKPGAVATNGSATSSATTANVPPERTRKIKTRSAPSEAMQIDEILHDIDIRVEPPSQTSELPVTQESLTEHSTFDDEPPAKRLRSSRSPSISSAQPPPAQSIVVSPAKDQDNPFEIGLLPEIAENRPWDDLDAEDGNDPTMVAEYVSEIFDYMKELELQTMPSSIYMNSQPELEWHFRGILMDWLIQVHERFRLLPETLFIAANLVDRFLSMRVVSLAKLQLVGITGLFVAAKYEEIMVPTLQDFLTVSDSDYSAAEILSAEKYLLRTLGWDLSYPNPMSFLRRGNKAEDYNANTRTLAKFFIEISVVEERLLKYTPSMLAAAGLWLARLILGKPEWDANLEHYSGYSEDKLIRCANIMINFLLQPIKHESLWKKYSKKKYMKCAVVARKWAEVRWPPEENRSSREEDEESHGLVDVDLAAALPFLREQALAMADDHPEAQDA